MRRAALLLVFLLGSAAGVWAHPLDPALLELRERDGGRFDVDLQTPRGSAIDAGLPPQCVPVSPEAVASTPRIVRRHWQVDCGGRGLAGGRIELWGLDARESDAVVRIELAGGRRIEQVLRAEAPSMIVAPPLDPAALVPEYFAVGWRYLLTAPQHLLLAVALVLLVPVRRRLLWSVAALALGQSATLSLAVLGVIRVSPAPLAGAIALSLLVVGLELARPRAGTAVLASIALGFGLLHGLGLAAALASMDLPRVELPRALLGFNLGIAAFEVFAAGVTLAVLALLRSMPLPRLRAVRLLPAYAIGSLAAFWFFEQIAARF